MNNIFKLSVFFIAISALFLTSCEYEKLEKKEIPAVVSFKNDVIPIFRDECLACHAAGQNAPDLSSDNAYIALTAGGYITDTTAVENNSLYESITSKSRPMPPTGLMSKEDIEIIKIWIIQGAKDN